MRRRLARLLTLVLLMELAILCCACAHIACHRCDGAPRCPICEIVRLGRRTALLLPAAALMLIGQACLSRRGRPIRPAGQALSLFGQGVRLND